MNWYKTLGVTRDQTLYPSHELLKRDIRVDENIHIKHPEHFRIFGAHVAIDAGLYCTTRLEIGSYVHIGPNVTVIGGENCKLILQDFSAIAAGTVIVCGGEDYVSGQLINPTVPAEYRKIIYSNIIFERYTCCGVNCSIMPGAHLHEGSVLGAGSVLTKETGVWGVYAGVPAKKMKDRPRISVIESANQLLQSRLERYVL